MKAINRFFRKNLHWFIVLGVALLCAVFMLVGHQSESGYITLDGKDAKIEEGTKQFIEDSEAAFNLRMLKR